MMRVGSWRPRRGANGCGREDKLGQFGSPARRTGAGARVCRRSRCAAELAVRGGARGAGAAGARLERTFFLDRPVVLVGRETEEGAELLGDVLIEARQPLVQQLLPRVVAVVQVGESRREEALKGAAVHEGGKGPEGVLLRHVEQEDGGVGRHALSVPELRVERRVRAQHARQRLLPRPPRRAEVDVVRHGARDVLVDLRKPLGVWPVLLGGEAGVLPFRAKVGGRAPRRHQLPDEAAHRLRHARADARFQLGRLAARIVFPRLRRGAALLPLVQLLVLVAHHLARQRSLPHLLRTDDEAKPIEQRHDAQLEVPDRAADEGARLLQGRRVVDVTVCADVEQPRSRLELAEDGAQRAWLHAGHHEPLAIL